MLEPGEDPQAALKREVLEETGYEVVSIEKIAQFYVSPGGSSERIVLFYVEVRNATKVAAGGGLVSENEDIQSIWYSPEELQKMVDAGDIHDAKTLIGALWFLRRSQMP